MHVNEIAQKILYNGFIKKQQNHLYILVANNLEQQQQLYKWYIKLHVCSNRHEQTPCGKCNYCIQVDNDNYINNVIIARKPEKKSIGVDEVAELQTAFTTTAQRDAERFFCIEHADSMTTQAANSVLKFLEEPTGKTIGFLFVKNEQKLLATIRSRGQIIRMLDEVDEAQISRITKKITDNRLQKSATFLLQIGYDEKVIIKHIENFTQKIESYITKIANGSPFIVAQTDLELPAHKTKTGTMILELFMHILSEHLKEEAAFETIPEHARKYALDYGKEIYIALNRTLQKNKYHMGIAMIITSFTLELETLIPSK